VTPGGGKLPASSSLGGRVEDVLRRAYSRDGYHLRGVTSVIVQAMVQLGLAEVAARGRYERFVLSEEGVRRGAALTRALLARRGLAAPEPVVESDAVGDSDPRATFCDRLARFLIDPESGSVTLDLVGGSVAPGWRVKVDRCGPRKFVLSLTARG